MSSRLWITVLCAFVVFLTSSRAADSHVPKTIRGVSGTPSFTYLDINNISTVLRNDGTADINALQSNSGLVFPRGTGKTAMFESGFLWGGKINDTVHVGGSTYRTGLQPGRIVGGVPESPDLSKNRIYRVRPDYLTADLSSEVQDQGDSAAAIRDQYAKDWNEWPAADGAPYADLDHDGQYSPIHDIPGIPGADQTVWFVSNDMNAGFTTNLYGTNPMGLELQVTVWAYGSPEALKNMLFKKYLLINKGTNSLDSMYVSQWADPDIGNSTDDYAGCDTALGLSYAYNAGDTDAVYAPLPPPAIGFALLQGPVIASPGDSARFGGRILPGYKNLPMAAHYYFTRGDSSVTDPTFGVPAGAMQFYNFFRGRVGVSGLPFRDSSGHETSFALYGDPLTGIGWIDGQLIAPGDRRIGLASGPFQMAPGDSQEVIVTELAAGAVPSVDRLAAITLLKQEVLSARAKQNVTAVSPASGNVPAIYSLLQNYPNPFNPATRISYTLPTQSYVTLKIFDVLGREVQTLVDGIQQPGHDEKIVNASTLASGLYFYRLDATSVSDPARHFSQTRKMVLVK